MLQQEYEGSHLELITGLHVVETQGNAWLSCLLDWKWPCRENYSLRVHCGLRNVVVVEMMGCMLGGWVLLRELVISIATLDELISALWYCDFEEMFIANRCAGWSPSSLCYFWFILLARNWANITNIISKLCLAECFCYDQWCNLMLIHQQTQLFNCMLSICWNLSPILYAWAYIPGSLSVWFNEMDIGRSGLAIPFPQCFDSWNEV